MEAIEFVKRYDQYLDEIKVVIRPELLVIIDEFKTIDPHDLMTPDTWFHNENDARGFIWVMFLNRAKKLLMIDV